MKEALKAYEELQKANEELEQILKGGTINPNSGVLLIFNFSY